MEKKDSIERNVDKLYIELKKILGAGVITSSGIVVIVVNLMQIVENYDDISGIQKKQIIVIVLNKFIDEKVEDPEEERDLKLLVSITVPSLIDTIISVDKKELQIKTRKCFQKFCVCI